VKAALQIVNEELDQYLSSQASDFDDAKEATAYNALVADWTELPRQAAAIHDASGNRQIRLDI
jgi:hypothetical protein